MIEPGLYQLLAADAGIAALVGSQIFAGAAPDDLTQLPCVAYSLVGGSSEPTLATTGVSWQRVEINGLAMIASGNMTPRDVAGAIRAAVIAAVNRWSAALEDGTNVLDTLLVNPGTDFVSEQRIFRCACEFRVEYTLPPA